MATLVSTRIGKDADARQDQEQLLKLFWNRAELKKGFDKLRRESLDLAEQVRKQEALTLKIQQRLATLEAHLANPDTAPKVATYYQLRGIWSACRSRLEHLARDLEKSRHAVEYRHHVTEFRRTLSESMSSVQAEARRVSQAGEALAAEVLALREQRLGRRGFWNALTRRRLTSEIAAKRLARRDIAARLDELNAEIEARAAAEPPEFRGLSVAARRGVNLRLIACAQELLLIFHEDRLAELAREAQARELTEVRYGDRRDCRDLRRLAEDRLQVLESDDGISERVKLRSQNLKEEVEYRNDGDTVPVAGSLGPIRSVAPGQTGHCSINILADEYWGLFEILLT